MRSQVPSSVDQVAQGLLPAGAHLVTHMLAIGSNPQVPPPLHAGVPMMSFTHSVTQSQLQRLHPSSLTSPKVWMRHRHISLLHSQPVASTLESHLATSTGHTVPSLGFQVGGGGLLPLVAHSVTQVVAVGSNP